MKVDFEKVTRKIRWFFTYTIRIPFLCIKNFIFCLKYPFYKRYNRWTGKFCGYTYTEYDQLNYGWQKAFGKQMSEDIKKAGKEYRKTNHKYVSWKNMIIFTDIKEKYGTLRLYANCIDEIQKVLTKYELLSLGYCIFCGKPTRYVTEGYINYLCEDCLMKLYKINNVEDIKNDSINYHRLNSNNKPEISIYENDKMKIIDLKEVYDIDFDKLWNIEK